MNVLEHTSNRLVLRYNPVQVWLTSALVVVIIFMPSEEITSPMAHTVFTVLFLTFAIAFLVWKGDRVTCYFDKRRGHFIRQSSGLRGTRSIQVPIREITCVNVVERRRYRKRFRESYVYWIYVTVSSSDPICLTSDSFFRKDNAFKLAWQVTNFLQLPPYSFQEARPRSLFSLW
jgi:hypothetical protein